MSRRATLAGWTLVGFLLRVYRLASQSLWSDEDITLDRATLPLRDLLATLPVEQAPGYFVWMRLWSDLAGTSDFALRYPSALAGAVAIPIAASLARRLSGRAASWPAAAITAANPFLVWYGQEARAYSLLAALGAGTWVAALAARASTIRRAMRGASGAPADAVRGEPGAPSRLRLARAPRGPAVRWIVVGVLAAALAYLHYYAILPLAALVALGSRDLVGCARGALARAAPTPSAAHPAGLRSPRCGLSQWWLIAGATAALLFAPWVSRAARVFDFPGWRTPTPARQVPTANLVEWAAGPTAGSDNPRFAAAAYLLLAGMGLAIWLWPAIRRRSPAGDRATAAILIATSAAGTSVLLALAQDSCPALGVLRGGACLVDMHPRYFAGVVPLLIVAVATGIGAFGRAPLRVGLTALVLATGIQSLRHLYFDPAYMKQDYRGFTQRVELAAGHEDTVLFLDGPTYGLVRRYEVADSPVKIVNLQSSGNDARQATEREARLAELAAEYPHLWLATTGEEEGSARGWLESATYRVLTEQYQSVTLRRFYAPAGDPAAAAPSPQQCSAGGAVCLAVAATPVEPGEPFAAALSWRVAGALPPEPKVSVRLLTTDEAVLAAADRPLPTARGQSSFVTREGLLPPAGAAAAMLEVVLYDGGTGDEAARWRYPLP